MGLAENTFSTQQPNAVWSDKINVQPGMHGVSRDYTSPLASVLPTTQLIQSVSVNSKKTYADGDLTLATKVKTSCIDSRESRIGLPHVAGSIGINNVEHDGVKMSLVEKVHGSSISVPHNHMDAESGVKQMGNTQAEKVGISGSSKGNRNKKRRSDEETSFLVKMARTEIRKKLDEWNAAAREKNECNATHNVENVFAIVPGLIVGTRIPQKKKKHKYDVVEVLEDYSEENGVKIVPLGKVAGFKSACSPSIGTQKK